MGWSIQFLRVVKIVLRVCGLSGASANSAFNLENLSSRPGDIMISSVAPPPTPGLSGTPGARPGNPFIVGDSGGCRSRLSHIFPSSLDSVDTCNSGVDPCNHHFLHGGVYLEMTFVLCSDCSFSLVSRFFFKRLEATAVVDFLGTV